MATAHFNPAQERRRHEVVQNQLAAITVEAIVLRQEHGDRARWWNGHGDSATCYGCRLASLRLGYKV